MCNSNIVVKGNNLEKLLKMMICGFDYLLQISLGSCIDNS